MAFKGRTMRWHGETGEMRIFEAGESASSAWVDHPEKVKPKAAKGGKKGKEKEPQSVPDEDRIAAITELRANGVEIADDATIDEINEAIDALTKKLEEEGTA